MDVRPLLALVAGALLLSATPALAQDASPEADASQIPLTTAEGRRDLYLEMPYYLGGFEPEIVMTRGEEHFANLDADDQNRLRLEGFLEAVDADIEDLVSGYALASQEGFFSFVVAIRVEGATPGTLLTAYLPILDADLIDPNGITARVGGRDVLIISSVGSDEEYVELYVYDMGDTIWMLQGPTDVVEKTLENLPNALPPPEDEAPEEGGASE